jgi:murein DD-endopeptidase MepM/ murein hydrolase activator NlpD
MKKREQSGMRWAAAGLVLLGVVFWMGGVAYSQEERGQGKPRAIKQEGEQEKLQAIKQAISESREKLQQTREQRQQVLGKLVSIKVELKQASQKLTRANEKIVQNQSKINQLAQELQYREEDLHMKSGLLGRRIREAYKNSGISYFDLLFASQSMSDLLTRLYFFEKIIGQDASVMQAIKSEMSAVKDKRATLSDRTREIKELAQVVVEQKKQISVAMEEQKKSYEELGEREEEYEKKIEELERSSSELEVLIRKKMAERGEKALSAHGTGALAWPLRGRFTSRFGAYRRLGRLHRHTGIDIAAPYGTPIEAADAGEIIFSGWWDGYGKAIVIDHGRNRSTVYGHMSRIYLQAGVPVSKGQTIGLVGSTGYSTGPHLHFEYRLGGKPVNPMPYLP